MYLARHSQARQLFELLKLSKKVSNAEPFLSLLFYLVEFANVFILAQKAWNGMEKISRYRQKLYSLFYFTEGRLLQTLTFSEHFHGSLLL